MPIYEIKCVDCGCRDEVLVMGSDSRVTCPSCGSERVARLMSATSSLTGREGMAVPGRQDTGCCGSRPGEADGCAGPGSCCGKN